MSHPIDWHNPPHAPPFSGARPPHLYLDEGPTDPRHTTKWLNFGAHFVAGIPPSDDLLLALGYGAAIPARPEVFIDHPDILKLDFSSHKDHPMPLTPAEYITSLSSVIEWGTAPEGAPYVVNPAGVAAWLERNPPPAPLPDTSSVPRAVSRFTLNQRIWYASYASLTPTPVTYIGSSNEASWRSYVRDDAGCEHTAVNGCLFSSLAGARTKCEQCHLNSTVYLVTPNHKLHAVKLTRYGWCDGTDPLLHVRHPDGREECHPSSWVYTTAIKARDRLHSDITLALSSAKANVTELESRLTSLFS